MTFREELEVLNLTEKEMFSIYRTLGRTYKDIAKSTGYSISSVDRRMRRYGLTVPIEREEAVDLHGEEWREVPIDGYRDYYVSNMGRVKRDGYIIKPTINKRGYLGVNIREHPFEVHRLVARAFIKEDLTSEEEVNHKNFNRSDARLSNLEIMTRKENINYTVDNGRSYSAKDIRVIEFILGELEKGRRDNKNISKEVLSKFNVSIQPGSICKYRKLDRRPGIKSRFKIDPPKPNKVITDEDICRISKELEKGRNGRTGRDVFKTLGIIYNGDPSKFINKLLNGTRKNLTQNYDIHNWNSDSTTIP